MNHLVLRHGLDKTVANYLPEEVLTEILKRLPVKSLLRFRCVLKSWNNLIQSRMFITIHLNYQKSVCKHLLFESPYGSFLSLRYDDIQCEEDYPLKCLPPLDSFPYWYSISDGLICLSTMSSKSMTCIRKSYLWNPAFRKYKTLPDYLCIPDLSLIRIDWEASAFGFSSKRNDYVVVKIMRFIQSENHRTMIAVYSLSTNSWKNISIDNRVALSYVDPNASVFVNGVAFWSAEKNNDVIIIVCFDTESNVVREISFPEVPESEYSTYCLERFDQSIAFFSMNSDVNGINIWVMEGDAMNVVSWMKKFSVTLPENIDCRVLGFRNNGEAILSKILEHGLVSYNYEKNKINHFVDSWDSWSFIGLDEVDLYDLDLNMPPFNINVFVESLEALEFLKEGC